MNQLELYKNQQELLLPRTSKSSSTEVQKSITPAEANRLAARRLLLSLMNSDQVSSIEEIVKVNNL